MRVPANCGNCGNYDREKGEFTEACGVCRVMSGGVAKEPHEEFLHPIDAYKGLKAKYLVFKADTGELVDNCFVLCPDKDPAAVEALGAYASATDNETLAEDIYNWVSKGEPMQGVTDNNDGYKWISVKDEPPKPKTGDDRWWGFVVLTFPNGIVDVDVAIYKFAANNGTQRTVGLTSWTMLPIGCPESTPYRRKENDYV